MDEQFTAVITGTCVEILKNFWWVFLFPIIVVFFKSASFKGWVGEKKVKARLGSLDAAVYRPFHDLILPSRDGTTQIDHIYVSPFGIFVVETKNYKGWIYGDEKHAKWTQVIYRQKYAFQNPLRQNYAHIKALAALTRIPENAFHSVVIFPGDCKFKTSMPENVGHPAQAIRHIQSFRTVLLSASDVRRVCAVLRQPEYVSTRAARCQHKHHLHRRHFGARQN